MIKSKVKLQTGKKKKNLANQLDMYLEYIKGSRNLQIREKNLKWAEWASLKLTFTC